MIFRHGIPGLSSTPILSKHHSKMHMTALMALLAATLLIDEAALAALTHAGLRVLQQQPENKIVGTTYKNITERVRCRRHARNSTSHEASSIMC